MSSFNFNNYIGQESTVAELQALNQPIPHLAFIGPQGSGKRTLAEALANEAGAALLHLPAESIERVGDLISPLLLIREGDILLISKAELLTGKALLACFKQAMRYQIKIRKEGCDPISLGLPRFTLILSGTTTPDELQLKTFFFKPLAKEHLAHILVRKCAEEMVDISPETIEDICSRATTPRQIFKAYRQYKELSICAPEPTFA